MKRGTIIFLSILIGVLIIAPIVYAEWIQEDKAVWHSAKDIKVTIGANSYTLNSWINNKYNGGSLVNWADKNIWHDVKDIQIEIGDKITSVENWVSCLTTIAGELHESDGPFFHSAEDIKVTINSGESAGEYMLSEIPDIFETCNGEGQTPECTISPECVALYGAGYICNDDGECELSEESELEPATLTLIIPPGDETSEWNYQNSLVKIPKNPAKRYDTGSATHTSNTILEPSEEYTLDCTYEKTTSDSTSEFTKEITLSTTYKELIRMPEKHLKYILGKNEVYDGTDTYIWYVKIDVDRKVHVKVTKECSGYKGGFSLVGVTGCKGCEYYGCYAQVRNTYWFNCDKCGKGIFGVCKTCTKTETYESTNPAYFVQTVDLQMKTYETGKAWGEITCTISES